MYSPQNKNSLFGQYCHESTHIVNSLFNFVTHFSCFIMSFLMFLFYLSWFYLFYSKIALWPISYGMKMFVAKMLPAKMLLWKYWTCPGPEIPSIPDPLVGRLWRRLKWLVFGGLPLLHLTVSPPCHCSGLQAPGSRTFLLLRDGLGLQNGHLGHQYWLWWNFAPYLPIPVHPGGRVSPFSS